MTFTFLTRKAWILLIIYLSVWGFVDFMLTKQIFIKSPNLIDIIKSEKDTFNLINNRYFWTTWLGIVLRVLLEVSADIPCSGSGTWARTPEQLNFSTQKSIEEYSALQKKIVSNAVQSLDEKGYFLYITCSVFKKENEENVNFIQKDLNLELVKSEYLKGYEMQSDTLFVALFKK